MEKLRNIYQKKVDWSLFKDGFAIPLDVQDYFQSVPELVTSQGDIREISLVIDGIPCGATLRNLHINYEKYPNRSPIIQIRYNPTDAVAQRFREVFSEAWQEIYTEKQLSPSRKQIHLTREDTFSMYTTENPTVFIIECQVSKEN